MSLRLTNPHSILAVLDRRPRALLELHLPPGGGGQAWEAVRQLAIERGVALTRGRAQRRATRRRGGHEPKTGRAGGGEALVHPVPGVPLNKLFDRATERADGRGLWLALDCLHDPHNLGAIIRTAAFFAVQGLVMTADRAAPLSGVACDTAAGGAEYLPCSIQTNLARVFELAKEAGLWILGTSERGDTDLADVPRDRPWLLVIGNEAQGIRHLTAERCDLICQVRPRGVVDSLNASVAAGILIAALA